MKRKEKVPSGNSPCCYFCTSKHLGLLFLLLAMVVLPAVAQHADTVVMFRPGSGPGIGREAKYFPKNVLGLPDSNARLTVPSVDPAQILSLGLGGEIVLGFRTPIVNRPGSDFTVFENAFHYNLGGTQRTFAEPAAVAVSSDGISFSEFSFDSLTLIGCAGITPTDGRADPFDSPNCGGNQFDLSILGVDSVRYIRIRDVTAIIINNPEHPFWDPTLTSFDLDAVVSLNTTPSDTGIINPLQPPISLHFTRSGEASVVFNVSQESHVRVRLWNRLGQQTEQVVDATLPGGNHEIPWNSFAISSGIWFLTLEEAGRLVSTHTFTVMR